MKNFEDILRELNPMGPWQIATIIQSCLAQLLISMPLYQANYFLAGTMDYNCTHFQPTTANAHNETSSKKFDEQCVSPVSGEKCDAWNYSSPYYESTMINEWNLVCDRSYLVPLYKSAFLIGFLVGVPLWGGMSDWIGRWPVFAVATPIQVMAFLITLVVHEFRLAALMRLLQGFAYAGTYKALFVLNVESVLPSSRNVVAVLYGVASPLAGILVSLFGLFIETHWRVAHLYAVGLCTLSIPLVLFLNESPRWLIVQGKFARAEQTLNRMAKWNRRELPPNIMQHMLTIRDEHYNCRRTTTGVHKTTNVNGLASAPSNVPSFTSLLRAPEMRKRTLALLIAWLVVAAVYYGSSFYAIGQLKTNPFLTLLLMSAARTLLAPLLIVEINLFGKKKTLTINLWLAGVFLIVLAVLVYCRTAAWSLILLAVCAVVSVSGAFETLYIFTGELYPTVLRQTGIALNSMSARVGAAISPYISDLLGTYWQPTPVLVFAVACFLATGMLFALPEMNNRVLPETVLDTEEEFVGNKCRQSNDRGSSSSYGSTSDCQEIEIDSIEPANTFPNLQRKNH